MLLGVGEVESYWSHLLDASMQLPLTKGKSTFYSTQRTDDLPAPSLVRLSGKWKAWAWSLSFMAILPGQPSIAHKCRTVHMPTSEESGTSQKGILG